MTESDGCGRDAAYTSFGTRDGHHLFILGHAQRKHVNEALAKLSGFEAQQTSDPDYKVALFEKVWLLCCFTSGCLQQLPHVVVVHVTAGSVQVKLWASMHSLETATALLDSAAVPHTVMRTLEEVCLAPTYVPPTHLLTFCNQSTFSTQFSTFQIRSVWIPCHL